MTRTPFMIETEMGDAAPTIWLTNPDDGNRLTGDDITALGHAIRAAGEDGAARVVVVRAEGDAFCLGRIPTPKKDRPPSALTLQEKVTGPIMGLYANVRATPVPVLAVVQGEARGFGCAFTGQCDLAIASSNAVFSMPEMDVNLPPTLAISAVLGKVPIKKLTHMVYTREKISAQEALMFGLIGEVCAPEDLNARTDFIIGQLVDRRRPALETIKQYLATAPHVDTAAAATMAEAMLPVVLSSPDD